MFDAKVVRKLFESMFESYLGLYCLSGLDPEEALVFGEESLTKIIVESDTSISIVLGLVALNECAVGEDFMELLEDLVSLIEVITNLEIINMDVNIIRPVFPEDFCYA